MNTRSFLGPFVVMGLLAALLPFTAVAQPPVSIEAEDTVHVAQDVVNWLKRYPPDKPSGRSGFSLAYDSAREEVVLFGGSNSTTRLNDTWVWKWNGNQGYWIPRSTGDQPSIRDGYGLAYDSDREVTVLFGGYDGTNRFNDTWEWDGEAQTWTQRFPVHQPSTRSGCRLVYDSAQGQIVLFGGYHSYGNDLNDTWVWKDGDWTELFPQDPLPDGRANHDLAYDSAREVTVLFGGWNRTIHFDDTWEWDGEAQTWTQRLPGSKPTPREHHRMAYDSARGVTVLFGGWDHINVFDDTWEWNGITWEKRCPCGRPSPRAAAGMAYDSARGVTVLFGGGDGTAYRFDDTWVYPRASPPHVFVQDITIIRFPSNSLWLWGIVRVATGNGATPVAGATVDVSKWRPLPCTSPPTGYPMTNANGRAFAPMSADPNCPGWYSWCVENVTKECCVYDPSSNLETCDDYLYP